MSVEMNYIGIYKIERDTINGCFGLKKYNNLNVEFEFKNEILSFNCGSKDKIKRNSFFKWRSNEKDFYATFILNYLNEINKINDMSSFEGEIIK